MIQVSIVPFTVHIGDCSPILVLTGYGTELGPLPTGFTTLNTERRERKIYKYQELI